MTTRAMIGPLSVIDPAGNVVTGARFRVVKFGTSSGYGTGVVIADQLYAGPSTGVTLANPSVATGTSFEAWANVSGGIDIPDYVTIEYDDNEGTAYPSGVTGTKDWRVEAAPSSITSSGGDLGWIDVEADGADNTGSSDATPVFQADMAVGDLYLKPGTYSLTDVLVNAGSFTRIRGGGMGLTILKARSGCTKLLDISSTDVTIQDLTIDGNGIAQYGLYFESLATGCTVERVEIKGCTTAGVANADQNHSTSFDRCYIHLNTGRGVIWIKRGQFTEFSRCRILANMLGQVQLGDGVTAMSEIAFSHCNVQSTAAFPGVPNFQVSAQINPLIIDKGYGECFGAGGTDITVDAGLSVSAISWTRRYSTGNAQANYQFVINSQVYMDGQGSHGISFVTANINDLTTTSRFFHFNTNENGSVRVPFKLDRVNPVFSVVTLTDAGTVVVDARLGRYFALSTAANRTFGAPSGPTAGMAATFDILNTSGGAITPLWNAAYVLGNGNVGPTIAAGKHHLVHFFYNGTNWIETGRSGDIG